MKRLLSASRRSRGTFTCHCRLASVCRNIIVSPLYKYSKFPSIFLKEKKEFFSHFRKWVSGFLRSAHVSSAQQKDEKRSSKWRQFSSTIMYTIQNRTFVCIFFSLFSHSQKLDTNRWTHACIRGDPEKFFPITEQMAKNLNFFRMVCCLSRELF